MSGLVFQPGHAQLQGDTMSDFLAPIAQLMGVQQQAISGIADGLSKLGASGGCSAGAKASGACSGGAHSSGGTSLSRARSGSRGGSRGGHRTGGVSGSAAQLGGFLDQDWQPNQSDWAEIQKRAAAGDKDMQGLLKGGTISNAMAMQMFPPSMTQRLVAQTRAGNKDSWYIAKEYAQSGKLIDDKKYQDAKKASDLRKMRNTNIEKAFAERDKKEAALIKDEQRIYDARRKEAKNLPVALQRYHASNQDTHVGADGHLYRGTTRITLNDLR